MLLSHWHCNLPLTQAVVPLLSRQSLRCLQGLSLGPKSTATRRDGDYDGGSLSARPEIFSAVEVPSQLASSISLLNRDPSEGLTTNCSLTDWLPSP